jgi:hypothetical protein
VEDKQERASTFVPNYIQHPPFFYATALRSEGPATTREQAPRADQPQSPAPATAAAAPAAPLPAASAGLASWMSSDPREFLAQRLGALEAEIGTLAAAARALWQQQQQQQQQQLLQQQFAVAKAESPEVYIDVRVQFGSLSKTIAAVAAETTLQALVDTLPQLPCVPESVQRPGSAANRCHSSLVKTALTVSRGLRYNCSPTARVPGSWCIAKRAPKRASGWASPKTPSSFILASRQDGSRRGLA